MIQESQERMIGLLLDPGPHVMIGMLGIMESGCGFVPLDPGYPRERIAFMLADCGIETLVTEAKYIDLAHRLARENPLLKHVVCLDRVEKKQEGDDGFEVYDYGDYARDGLEDRVVRSEREHLVYVVYTSGSTGMPKGVPITHENLVPMLRWGQEYLGLGEHTRTLQSLSFCFDFGIFEVLTTVLFGGTVYFLDREEWADAASYARYVNEQGINTINATPSFFRMLAAVGTKLETLELLHLGGEELTNRTLDEIFGTVGEQCVVYNGYGPTEATINSTIFPVGHQASRRHEAANSVPIGKVSANNRLYVLDGSCQLVPVGVTGELHVGGVGLARGYLNRSALTAERFIPNPFNDEVGGRLYRTGDRVRYLPDGNIEFLGRMDYQVKIRGYRVELGEIEAALAEHPEVQEAVVVAREDRPDEKHLVGYVVPADDGQRMTANGSGLRSYLKDRLPEYMLPAAFVTLEALPLTPNGKVDRRALPAPEGADLGLAERPVALQDALELRLVRIWESVLGVQPIGVNHNFFDLGGHSLLAVRLLARVHKELGQQLPLVTLFRGATVRQLAEVLRQRQGADEAFSSLVQIQAGDGNKRPLFFVHPVGGSVLCYADLSRHLEPDQPFYGLQALGLDDGQQPHTRVEVMARHYLDLIQTVQAEGPYLLGGWSMGGVVAFEMAQQLRAQGQTVARLVLIDSHAPTGAQVPEPDEIALLASFALDLGLSWQQIPLAPDHLERLEPGEGLAFVLEQARQAGVVPPEIELAQAQHLFQVFKSNLRAVRKYAPRPYPGRVTLLKAQEQLDAREYAPDLGWGALVDGDVAVHEVAGNHYTLVREPNVKALAAQIRNDLGEELL